MDCPEDSTLPGLPLNDEPEYDGVHGEAEGATVTTHSGPEWCVAFTKDEVLKAMIEEHIRKCVPHFEKQVVPHGHKITIHCDNYDIVVRSHHVTAPIIITVMAIATCTPGYRPSLYMSMSTNPLHIYTYPSG